MARSNAQRGRKKRNKGWFKKGHDARRSNYRFTKQDCRMGWWVANILHPELREWLRMRLYCYYSQRKRSNGETCEETGNGGSPVVAVVGTDGEADDIPW